MAEEKKDGEYIPVDRGHCRECGEEIDWSVCLPLGEKYYHYVTTGHPTAAETDEYHKAALMYRTINSCGPVVPNTLSDDRYSVDIRRAIESAFPEKAHLMISYLERCERAFKKAQKAESSETDEQYRERRMNELQAIEQLRLQMRESDYPWEVEPDDENT